MKKLIVVSVLGLVVSAHSFAAGSKIERSTVTNQSLVSNSQNLALGLGRGNVDANQGSIAIKGSTVKSSRITNQALVSNSQNLALGLGRGDVTANQASIDIK